MVTNRNNGDNNFLKKNYGKNIAIVVCLEKADCSITVKAVSKFTIGNKEWLIDKKKRERPIDYEDIPERREEVKLYRFYCKMQK